MRLKRKKAHIIRLAGVASEGVPYVIHGVMGEPAVYIQGSSVRGWVSVRAYVPEFTTWDFA